MGTRSLYNVPTVFWFLLTLLFHMLTCLRTNGFSIKLIPRYSIDSVLFPKNLSQLEKHNKIVQLSKARALQFQSMNFSNAIYSTEQGIKALHPMIMYHPGNFYVTQMDIGTPPYSALLLLDPGSDTTWVQGDGCIECLLLSVGNFKYQDSRTYSHMPCGDPHCSTGICEGNLCSYEFKYVDGSYTKGKFSFETFKFFTRDGGQVSYPDVAFGVGLDNKNIVFSKVMGDENRVGGVFGLGRGPLSILRQLKHHTDLRFSYCLYDWAGRENINTYLHFGEDAQIEERYQAIVKTIPLLPNQNRYYVEVLGISMNEKRLQINAKQFQLRPDSRGGFVLDAGAALTHIVQNAYNIIRDEIVRYLQAYNWEPIRLGGLPYDLCYDVQQAENQPLPSLTIHFLEADLKLPSHRVFQKLYNNIFCMFILPTPQQGLNLFGAFQQADYRFLFDVGKGEVKFIPDNCQFY